MIAADVLDRALNTIGESLPRIGGAILLLVVGVIVARILGRLARRAIAAVGADELAERYGVHDVLARVGIDRPLSRVAGRVVRIVLTVVVVFAAVALLGLGALSAALNEALLFVPRILVALALVVVGAILAQVVGDWVDRIARQMGSRGRSGGLCRRPCSRSSSSPRSRRSGSRPSF